MGRAKHINVFSTPKKEDYDIINKTLEELKISNVSLLMKKVNTVLVIPKSYLHPKI